MEKHPIAWALACASTVLAGLLPGAVLGRFPDGAAEVWAGPAAAAAAGLVSGMAAAALCALRCTWRPRGVFALWLLCALATAGGEWIARVHLSLGPRPAPAAFACEAAATALAAACVAWFAVRPRYFCRACGRRGRGAFRLENLCILVPEARACGLLASGDVSPLLSSSPVAEPGRAVVTVEVRHCADCCRGAMWVSRTGSAKDPRLQGVALAPDSVRALLELAHDETARRARMG